MTDTVESGTIESGTLESGTLESGRPDRRGAPRVPVGWVGQYVIPSRPDLGWGECRVVDVSESGIGLMLFGPWPDDAEASIDIIVRVEPEGDTEPVQVSGLVRNTDSVNIGELRVGIEFAAREGTELISLLGEFTPKVSARLP